jgi:peptidoglycan hydrolase CwlO-like protein
MQKELVILCLAVSIVLSCGDKKKTPPAILEGKKIDVSSLYKKRSDDLVQALYEEVVSRSAELEDLEKQIEAIKKQWPDSSDAFKKFNEKNNSYYRSADKNIETIRDSVLRKRIRAMVTESRKHYADSITTWTNMDSLIVRRTAMVNDLHALLKIAKTLPLIEEFQKNNTPATKPGEEVIKNYDLLIARMDSLFRVARIDSTLHKK